MNVIHSQPSDKAQVPVATGTHWRKDAGDLATMSVLIISLATIATVFALNFHRGMVADEAFHFRQISKLARGEGISMQGMPYPPGYHVVQAAASYFYPNSLNFCRLTNCFAALTCIAIFYYACRTANPRVAGWRSVQLLMIPIILPYWALVYTDALSLALLLLAVMLSLQSRVGWAAVILLASLLVRQSNIVWAAFIFVALYTDTHGYRITRDAVMNHVSKSWALIVVGVAFILFVLLNGGVSIGGREAHSVSFQLGNVYFFLAMYAILMAPRHISDLINHRLPVGASKAIILSAALLITIAGMWLINNEHPYYENDYYVRHRFINFICQTPYHRLILSIPAAIGFVFLASTCYSRSYFKSLIPFVFLSLAPIPLIEQRYSIPAFCMLLLAQNAASKQTERTAAIWLTAISVMILTLLLYNQHVFL